jgi:CRISPR-associated protein Cas6
MFWDDENSKQDESLVTDAVVDVAFKVTCPTIPLDHAYALSAALLERLPWLQDETHAGVHLIHGAASGNGWYRPENVANELLHLSKRTRLRLRVPKKRLQDTQALTGETLDIEGHPLVIGKSDLFMLSSLPTLFSRYVVAREEQDETAFLEEAATRLQELNIPCRKMLGGITHTLRFPDGPVFTRSLMVADLEPEQSLRLQQVGLGSGRTRGCGIFLPHKGIKPVKEPDAKP